MSETAALLDDLVAFVRRFVVITDAQARACALWIAHTYIFGVADTTPYLLITSAEKQSGKTHLLRAIRYTCHRPKQAANITEAALFRAIAKWQPTMLVDEVDGVFGLKRREPSERQEMIRTTLNAGFERDGNVIRTATNGEPEEFNVYCPKVLCGIGHLPDTVRDRGLAVRMTRRTREEPIEKQRLRTLKTDGGKLAARLEAWSSWAALQCAGEYPEMPEELDDRAQDAYEILVAIADLAGDEWGQKARLALVHLRAEDQGEQHESSGLLLLRDVAVFADRLAGMERIPTADLLALLYEEGECPWEEWWGELTKKKAPRRLGLALGEFGLKPERWREGAARHRGYKVAPILDALDRYMDTQHGPHGTMAQPSHSEDTQHGTDEEARPVSESADLQGKARVPVLDGMGEPGTLSDGDVDLLQSPISEWPW